MSVGTWNPSAQITELSNAILQELLVAAGHSSEREFGLSPTDIERLAGAAHSNRMDWQTATQHLGDGDLVALVRFFTLAEARFDSWQAGANSPVIVMARALRERGAWPADLTAWIKRHTDNKFLPYGSLLQRL